MATPKEAFFTRSKANEGVKVDLVTPTGEKTEHWIRVRGTDSDAYRRKRVDCLRRRILEIEALKDPDKKRDAEDANQIDLVSSLVVAWSFGDCSPAAVTAFLTEAPQVAAQIEEVAADRERFFGAASSSSVPTPSTDSASTSPLPPEAINPSEAT